METKKRNHRNHTLIKPTFLKKMISKNGLQSTENAVADLNRYIIERIEVILKQAKADGVKRLNGNIANYTGKKIKSNPTPSAPINQTETHNCRRCSGLRDITLKQARGWQSWIIEETKIAISSFDKGNNYSLALGKEKDENDPMRNNNGLVFYK